MWIADACNITQIPTARMSWLDKGKRVLEDKNTIVRIV